MTSVLRWEPVSYQRNAVVADTNMGRFYIRRSAKYIPPYFVSLSGAVIGQAKSFKTACVIAEAALAALVCTSQARKS